jgi:hypothetical protein
LCGKILLILSFACALAWSTPGLATDFQGSWLYTAMASAPAGTQGVRDALDELLEKGRISPEEEL